jgi:hypothetical protein
MDNQFASQPAQIQTSQQPVANQPQPLPSASRRSTKLPLLTLVFVVLFAGAVYGVYAWQHSKVTELNAQALSSKSQSATQANKIADLNKQISASSKAATSTQAPAATTGPVDQTAAITQAVKAYKDNVSKASTLNVTINGVTASGNAAYGTNSTPGQDGGGAWLAVNSNGSWSVVSQGAVGVCKSQVQQYNLPAIWAGDISLC